jgi:hypothetical protein
MARISNRFLYHLHVCNLNGKISSFSRKKSDALVGHVNTFHILQTSELAIFSRNPSQISKILKSGNQMIAQEILEFQNSEYEVHQSSSTDEG